MKKIEWPEFKFPPINLWVLAGSPVFYSHGCESTHNHRSQRPGMKGNHENTLHYLMADKAGNAPGEWRAGKKAPDGFFTLKTESYDRIKKILAMRGGTYEH